MAEASEAAALSALLGAPSKDAVTRLFGACFRHRHHYSDALSTPAVTELGLDASTSEKLVAAVVAVIQRALYDSADIANAEAVVALLPKGLDARLQTLVATVIFASLHAWRDAAVEQRVSLPRLESTSWRVDVVGASSSLQSANEPVVTLNLTIRGGDGGGDGGGAMPEAKTVAVALNAHSLGALVDSMRRIKDQLASLQ